ncbi:MAG: HEAT repeat domain-containing protein [Acidimicrobiia bacterium]
MASEGPAVARATALVALGLRPDADPLAVDTAALDAVADPDSRVRAAAVGALTRAGTPAAAHTAWATALTDEAASVRRRAAELTPMLATKVASKVEAPDLIAPLLATLEDDDATVVEAAAWALGEMAEPAIEAGATSVLATTATTNDDPIAREAAVAALGALGALGDEAGLEAILQACRDTPAVRRRAVLALAPFEGPEVEAAIEQALNDRDWQVRQAAEDLSDAPTEPDTTP